MLSHSFCKYRTMSCFHHITTDLPSSIADESSPSFAKEMFHGHISKPTRIEVNFCKNVQCVL